MATNFPFRLALLGITTSILMSACHPALKEPNIITHSEVVETPEFISHEKPILIVDAPTLESVGCPPADQSGISFCTDSSELKSAGCFSVFAPDSLLGGLSPAYPLLICAMDGNKYLYKSGCLVNLSLGLVVYKDGIYHLIDSESKLRKIYAPIETENEALSYALAGTGLSAYYNLSFSDEYEYYVDRIEDTYVFKDGRDFLVHLYDYRLCGCGQHETYIVEVRVTRTGYIKQIRKELVYRDINWSCID
ncbi:MAG: hypothetical protein ACOYZ6_17980 [Chloroflexota bacterium]